MLKLTTSYFETPLYYSTWGDDFYDKRWYKLSKTPPEKFEEAEPQSVNRGPGLMAEKDLNQEVFQIEAYYDDLNDYQGLQLENERVVSKDWIESRPLALEEYKYFHAVIFLMQRT